MTLLDRVTQHVRETPSCKTCDAGLRRHARLFLLLVAHELEQAGQQDAAQLLIRETRQ